jgi:hypothetical protein
LKSLPVKPSANSHVVPGAVTAVASWPPSKFWKYIARSTKIGWVAVTDVEKLDPANAAVRASVFT